MPETLERLDIAIDGVQQDIGYYSQEEMRDLARLLERLRHIVTMHELNRKDTDE